MVAIIVSAYYRIPSKQPHEWYVPYLQNFFRCNHGKPVHFYTSADLLAELQAFEGADTVNFHIRELVDFVAYRQWGPEFWAKHRALDSESYHTVELGMIWYEKKCFVLDVIEQLQPTDPNQIFIWCDAGCIRGGSEIAAAQAFGLRARNWPTGRLLMQHIDRLNTKRFTKAECYVWPTSVLAGAIMAGDAVAWRAYKELYDRVLEHYDQQAVSGISDQYISLSCYDRLSKLFYLYYRGNNRLCEEWFSALCFL